MTDKTLADIADVLKDIDFCHMATRTDGGAIAARPMSTNSQVEYDGDSWFFTKDNGRLFRDISADPTVTLTFHGSAGVMAVTGKPGPMIVVQGGAEVIRDKATFEKHWVPELEYWFEGGIDDPHMVMLKVHAHRINYWNIDGDGEITL